MRSPKTAAESCFGRVRSIEWGAVYEQCLRLSVPVSCLGGVECLGAA